MKLSRSLLASRDYNVWGLRQRRSGGHSLDSDSVVWSAIVKVRAVETDRGLGLALVWIATMKSELSVDSAVWDGVKEICMSLISWLCLYDSKSILFPYKS